MVAYSNQKFETSDYPRLYAAMSTVHCNPARWDVTDMSAIRNAAAMFIERFGDQAAYQAAVRAEELLHAGNFEGRVRWQLITRAIYDLIAASNLEKFQSSLITINDFPGGAGQSGTHR